MPSSEEANNENTCLYQKSMNGQQIIIYKRSTYVVDL